VSKATRINRPTTATSTKPRKGTMIHQSTDYRWINPPPAPNGAEPQPVFMKAAKGRTC